VQIEPRRGNRLIAIDLAEPRAAEPDGVAVMGRVRHVDLVAVRVVNEGWTRPQPGQRINPEADRHHVDLRVGAAHDRTGRRRVIKGELAVSERHVGREYSAHLLEGGVNQDARIGLWASHVDLQGQPGQSGRGWEGLGGPHPPGWPYSRAGKSEDN